MTNYFPHKAISFFSISFLILSFFVLSFFIHPSITLGSSSNECPTAYDPVCGENGKTYHNACHMLIRSDLYNNRYPETKVAHTGVCTGSDNITTQTYNTGSDNNTNNTIIQPTNTQETITIPDINHPTNTQKKETKCPLLYQPLCGIDHETYPNQCVADKKHMTIAYTGECGENNPIMETCSEYFNGCTLCQVQNGKITRCIARKCPIKLFTRCTKHTYDISKKMRRKIQKIYNIFYRSLRKKEGRKTPFTLKKLRDNFNEKIADINNNIDIKTITTSAYFHDKFIINIYNTLIQLMDKTIIEKEGYYYPTE